MAKMNDQDKWSYFLKSNTVDFALARTTLAHNIYGYPTICALRNPQRPEPREWGRLVGRKVGGKWTTVVFAISQACDKAQATTEGTSTWK